jgi:hypothetical protein
LKKRLGSFTSLKKLEIKLKSKQPKLNCDGKKMGVVVTETFFWVGRVFFSAAKVILG